MKIKKTAQYRKKIGQGIFALTLVMFFIFALVGVFVFEVNRAQLVNKQLLAIADSASLAGTAMLASMDNSNLSNLTNNQTTALNFAAEMAHMNTVGMDSLASAPIANNPASTSDNGNLKSVTAHNAKLFIGLVDPLNNFAAVPLGDQRGLAIKVSIGYGHEPPFGKFCGLNNYPLVANSTSALPRIDTILCFDLSGSMDDSTRVTFICRSWNPPGGTNSTGHPVYTILPRQFASSANSRSSDLGYYVGLNTSTYPDGTALNANFPHNLQYAWDGVVFNNPLQFRGDLRSPGASDAGYPPGDDPSLPSPAGSPGNRDFTDLTVNIFTNATPTTSQPVQAWNQESAGPYNGTSGVTGITFKDPVTGTKIQINTMAQLVEAARGNLESLQLMQNAKLDMSTNYASNPAACGAAPQPGAQACYRRLAAYHTQPLATALQAAQQGFFNLLHRSADTHFGLVGFSTVAGNPTSPVTQTHPYVAQGYTPTVSGAVIPAPGTQGDFPIPAVALNKNETNVQSYDNVTQALQSNGQITNGITCLGTTAIGDSLQQAYDMMMASDATRVAAKRAIVLFTDGQPSGANQVSLSHQVAAQCKAAGIPIYTVGLALNPNLAFNQHSFLGDTANTNGIAYKSGNGARYFPCTTATQVKTAFENIARRLVVLRQ
jgi:hypothetical protein